MRTPVPLDVSPEMLLLKVHRVALPLFAWIYQHFTWRDVRFGVRAGQLGWSAGGDANGFASAYNDDLSRDLHRRVQSADLGGYFQPRRVPSRNSLSFTGGSHPFANQHQQLQQGRGSGSYGRGSHGSGGGGHQNGCGGSMRKGGSAYDHPMDRGAADTNGYNSASYGRPTNSGGSSPQVGHRFIHPMADNFAHGCLI